MSYRYKDSQSQPSSLPRRYYSLPKNYSTPSTNDSKDSSHSSRYRSTSSSSATSSTRPSTQSLRYGSVRTYGTSSNTSLTDDLKKPTSRRSGASSVSSRPVVTTGIPRKGSYGSSKSASLSSSPPNLRDPTPTYSARHVSSTSYTVRNPVSSSLSTDLNWNPGGTPIRQRSSITLRETQPTWGPTDPPVRQHSSSSLRDSPFTLSSRRTHSSSQGYSDSETRTTSSRKLSPVETVSRRPVSPSSLRYKDYSKTEETKKTSSDRKLSPSETTPTRRTSSPTVRYEGGHELKSEKPASPTSPTVQYSGSLPRKESPSSQSEASTTSSSRRGSGSSGNHNAPSDNDDELESSAARDISLLSREITSAYEGSLSRSDSRREKTSNLPQKQETTERKSSKERAKQEKKLSSEKNTSDSRKSSREQSPGTDGSVKIKKGHKRSASTGSATMKDENKAKPVRKISGIFSRKKSQSTDSEDDEERTMSKSSGLFSRKDSKDSVKDSQRRGSSSPSHSPPVSPVKRKISGPGRLFGFSSDSKTTPELPKKFSVPGKFFANKETKSGDESSDLESETTRASRPPMKRRVSLPGILGLPRSSSAERTSGTGTRRLSPDPAVDPILIQRRRSNFKKAQSFDVQGDKGKNSMLSKLKFWDHTKKDKSPDSRHSTSPEEGRSRSTSPAAEPSVRKISTEEESGNKTSQSRKSRERIVKRKTSQEKEVPELKVDSPVTVKPDSTQAVTVDEILKISSKVTHSPKEDDSVNNTLKEPKVLYVGPVESPSPSEQRARKRAQYKVNSVEKENESTVNATENSTQSKDAGISNAAGNKVEVKPLDSTDGSTRDTVSKLRERRRRRREERERFFASLANTTKEATQKDHVKQTDNDKNLKPDSAVEAVQDKVDGRTTTNDKLNEKVSTERNNYKKTEPTPKLSIVGKRNTVDELEKGKVRNGKARYQTIASSVHADIIADLIREKGLKTTTNNEVKIPSVAELRSKFLISKDDAKVTSPRNILKLEDRPHSICGGVLSPTEMKKFEDITFSLAKKVSSDDVNMKKFSDSSSDSLPKLDTKWKTISPAKDEKSPPSSPILKSSLKKDKKNEKVTNEENQVKEEQDLSVDSDTLKRRRGSKKKRKKSIFGSDKDKEPKSPEEDIEMPQHGAVSSAIKAMFSRKPSTTEKVKSSRKLRSKTVPGSPEAIKSATESRERKKSAPSYTVEPKSPEVETQPVKVEKKVEPKVEKVEKNVEVKDLEKEKDIELQPISDLEQKPVKERKSLKKPSKNKTKRKFNSSMKPFSMMKTKSESNLVQRFDFVAVDIPLEADPEPQKKVEEEKRFIENEQDKTVKQEEESEQTTAQKGRRPSVFEEGLKEFYDLKTAETKDGVKAPEITLEDLDVISDQTSQQQLLTSLAGDRTRIKPKRHHKTTSNPVKNLQQRNDIRTDTEVERPRIEKKQVTSEHPVIKRKKKKYKDPENLWRRHTLDLAASAIAGLASTEDFTKVRLRKTAGPEEKEKDEFNGTKPIMLIHIKGRRHLQVRLVEPSLKSLNSGDCFALVTGKDLFAWIGKDCNPYEKAKVTEIVSKIKTKNELNCKARDIVTIEEGDMDYNAALDKFANILSGDPGSNAIKDAKSMAKDEEYEKGVVKGNMVYKIHWTEPPTLMPVESMCGHIPQVSIFDTKEVFIFDFGSELYVWNGQQSLSGQRKSAFALAKQLYEEPFKPHAKNCDPIFPYGKSESCNNKVDNKESSGRPSWTLFARLHEKAETILFREKFLDWPDPTKIIRMKGHPSMLELAPKPPPVELKPVDSKSMLKCAPPLQSQLFEGVNVGRGNGVPTVWVGDIYKEGNLVNTVGLTVWHINEYRHFEVPAANIGHFHSGEGYVIRWAYFVLADRIAKDRKSRCRSTVAGRVRCAYFFWQGNDCSVNEKGAAAIMAVELDEEKGPQVRVVQGKETPVFLNLFKGGMIIHTGRKNLTDENTATFSDTSETRLYVVRNEEPGEACLNQVKSNSYSLRSRTSLILVSRRETHIYLWHGSKSSEDSRATAKAAARKMQERKSIECNMAGVSAFSLSEIEEGSEPDEFWKAIGGKKFYCSLAHDPSKHNYQPRLFELSSATGKFTFSEVLCPARSEPKLCPFPFLQEDLYTAKQPALFIVDGYYEVYVWEGWMPEDDDDVRTGSGRQRWDRDRKLAMETALNYAKEAGKRVSHRAYVVYAGMEPMTFKALFPYWNETPDVIKVQKTDGKQPNVKHSASELLQQFTKEFYTLAELQKIPPPQGVDPAKLEEFLSDSDFKEIFKMDKEAFSKLPGWKQVNLKKAVGLF